MSTTDWPPLEAQTIPLPTIVSSSDLFDGELFGDELMDIYNSSVEVSDSDQNGEDFKKGDMPSEDVLTALDDGFADFHASNNFNDLATFLTPHSDSQEVNTMLPLPLIAVEPIVPIATTAPTVAVQVSVTVQNSQTPPPATNVKTEIFPTQTKTSKKRASDGQPSASPRKKTTTARRSSGTKKSKTTTTNSPPVVPPNVVSSVLKPVESTTGLKESEQAKQTPNPLTLGSSLTETKKPKLVISKKGGVQHNVKSVVQEPSPLIVTSAPAPNAILPSGNAVAQASALAHSTSVHDFKNLAQAAVSDLITNLSVKSQETKSISDTIKVDTSTAHIKALTATNWVSSSTSSTGQSCIPDSSATASSGNSVCPDSCDAKSTDSNNNNGSSRCKRQNLSADERARQNRDRNREHARNTRLRKKAYVEELKHTLTELVSQRDASELEKRQSAQRELEQREVRFRVIEEFLKLRGRNETNFARWAAILEDDFMLTVPWFDVNQLRSGSPTASTERTSTGVSNAMTESANFSILLQSIIQGKGCMSFQYTCDRKDFFMDNCNAFLEWSGTAVDSAGKPDLSGISLKGVVRAKFSPASNKLLSLALMFDTSVIVYHFQKINATAFNTVCDTTYDVIAAQVAASQANAIIDSIQMPCMSVEVPSAVNFVHASSSSEASSEKCELDSDESISGHSEKASFVTPSIVIRQAS